MLKPVLFAIALHPHRS